MQNKYKRYFFSIQVTDWIEKDPDDMGTLRTAGCSIDYSDILAHCDDEFLKKIDDLIMWHAVLHSYGVPKIVH